MDHLQEILVRFHETTFDDFWMAYGYRGPRSRVDFSVGSLPAESACLPEAEGAVHHGLTGRA